jgi:hypothetical protein
MIEEPKGSRWHLALAPGVPELGVKEKNPDAESCHAMRVTHVAFYAGWPQASKAITPATRTLGQ